MAVSRMLVTLIFLLLATLPLRAETLFCEVLPEEGLDQLELRLSNRAVTRGDTLEVVVLGRDQNGKMVMTDHEVQLVVHETVIPLSLREGLGMTKISTGGLPVGTFEVFARIGSVVSRQDELDVLVMPSDQPIGPDTLSPTLREYGLSEIDMPLDGDYPDGSTFKMYWGDLETGASMVPLVSAGDLLRAQVVGYGLPDAGEAWIAFRGRIATLPNPDIIAQDIDVDLMHVALTEEAGNLSLTMDNIRYPDERNIEDGTQLRLLVQSGGRNFIFYGQTLSGRAQIQHLPAFVRQSRSVLEVRDRRIHVETEGE